MYISLELLVVGGRIVDERSKIVCKEALKNGTCDK